MPDEPPKLDETMEARLAASRRKGTADMASDNDNAEAVTPPKKRRWFRMGCLLGALVAAVLGGLVLRTIIAGPHIAAHVSADDCPYQLPAGASDVSYLSPAPLWPNTAFEFSIDEKSFVKWAQERDWPLKEIKDEPVRMHRYCWWHVDGAEPETAEISNGLTYSWTEEDRGVYVAYDRDKGRAYYLSHSR